MILRRDEIQGKQTRDDDRWGRDKKMSIRWRSSLVIVPAGNNLQSREAGAEADSGLDMQPQLPGDIREGDAMKVNGSETRNKRGGDHATKACNQRNKMKGDALKQLPASADDMHRFEREKGSLKLETIYTQNWKQKKMQKNTQEHDSPPSIS